MEARDPREPPRALLHDRHGVVEQIRHVLEGALGQPREEPPPGTELHAALGVDGPDGDVSVADGG
jgi:hypothetical protein